MSKELLERLSELSQSQPYTRKALTEAFDNRQNELDVKISELERKKMSAISKILKHPEFQQLVATGNITLAAIKPHTEKSYLGTESDIEGEGLILEEIRKGELTSVFSISLNLDSADVNEFYPAELRFKLRQMIQEDGENQWLRFANYMLSGPVTYLLLYDPEEKGEAVEKWRRQIGATNPQNAMPSTIRGMYALSTQNNLVHGSANIDDAKREVAWLRKKINPLKHRPFVKAVKKII